MQVFFLTTFIVTGMFSLGFVFLPTGLIAAFGVSSSAAVVALARLFGSALLAFPVMLWFARRSHSPEFRRAMLLGICLYYLVSLVVLLQAVLGGLMNSLGWSVVVLHLALAVWSGILAAGDFVTRPQPA